MGSSGHLQHQKALLIIGPKNSRRRRSPASINAGFPLILTKTMSMLISSCSSVVPSNPFQRWYPEIILSPPGKLFGELVSLYIKWKKYIAKDKHKELSSASKNSARRAEPQSTQRLQKNARDNKKLLVAMLRIRRTRKGQTHCLGRLMKGKDRMRKENHSESLFLYQQARSFNRREWNQYCYNNLETQAGYTKYKWSPGGLNISNPDKFHAKILKKLKNAYKTIIQKWLRERAQKAIREKNLDFHRKKVDSRLHNLVDLTDHPRNSRMNYYSNGLWDLRREILISESHMNLTRARHKVKSHFHLTRLLDM